MLKITGHFRTGKMTRLLRLAGLGARVGVAGGTLVLLHQQGVWGDSSQVIRTLDAPGEGFLNPSVEVASEAYLVRMCVGVCSSGYTGTEVPICLKIINLAVFWIRIRWIRKLLPPGSGSVIMNNENGFGSSSSLFIEDSYKSQKITIFYKIPYSIMIYYRIEITYIFQWPQKYPGGAL
jgi:hypothetical protein